MLHQSKLHNLKIEKLWIIGTGYMSKEYVKVLTHLNKKFTVIARGDISANNFKFETGISPLLGGLNVALKNNIAPEIAIIAVSIEELFQCTKSLLLAGCKKILVEKPAVTSIKEIKELIELKKQTNSEIFVAYNRRFFKSIIELKKKIKDEEGISSLNFEFTELGYNFKNQDKSKTKILDKDLTEKFSKKILEKWLIANSSHVIDLVFYLIGTPQDNNSAFFYLGESEWHKPMKYCGAGLSKKNIPFSYQANWDAPGRWSIEVLTKYMRYILRPMEELHCIRLGEFESNKVELNSSPSDNFKSGLLEQCISFLSNNYVNLCSIENHCEHYKYYLRIAGYE
tara:strand:- start:19 stop:1038 length:1020 start_codon:yes stop_codon:yes gene_type:complete